MKYQNTTRWNYYLVLAISFAIISTYSCTSIEYEEVAEIEIILNPSNRAPLAAVAKIKYDEPFHVDIRVIGKNGVDSDITHTFKSNSKKATLPILGLYPDYNNQVTFTFRDAKNQLIGQQLAEIQTEVYNGTKMEILDKANRGEYEPGFISVATHDPKNGFTFWDDYGDLRGVYNIPAYYATRLKNGNYFYTKGGKLYEIDIVGAVVNTIDLPDAYARGHHDFFELPDGKTLLLLVDKKESLIITAAKDTFNTIEDHLIAIDRETGTLLKEWDFREILDIDRYTLHEGKVDWLHSNAVFFEARDSSIIISAGKQGIFKVGYNDSQLKWLLSPHVNFGNAGWNGQIEWNPADYLLTAVNSKGIPYNEAIQKGLAYPSEEEESFHWSFSQHNPIVVNTFDEGIHLLVFNNESAIILDGENVKNAINKEVDDSSNNQDEYKKKESLYKLAKAAYKTTQGATKEKDYFTLMIEYKINEKQKTVQQFRAFNQDRFSPACSGVDMGETTGNYMMFGTGFCTGEGRFTEFTKDGEIVFDCNFLIDAYRGLYRSDKYTSLYPDQSIFY